MALQTHPWEVHTYVPGILLYAIFTNVYFLIWVHVNSCTFTVVATNIGEYQVSVKHTIISILHCCCSVMVHIDPPLSLHG